MAAIPADADALSFSPVGDTFADRIDNSRDFVAGDARAESAKRVASAVGEGAMAVMLVHRYLEKL